MMQATQIKVQYPEDTKLMEIVITTLKSHQTAQEVAGAKEIISKGKYLDVDIKQHRNKRSLDANSYCWVLCQKIAEVIKSTKELVYQKAIREVGQFEIVPIKNEAVGRWIEVWHSKGLGWFAEVLEDSKFEGYKKVISYYGSSVYDTREMSVLLEEIISEAKELKIETMPEAEKAAMLREWGQK